MLPRILQGYEGEFDDQGLDIPSIFGDLTGNPFFADIYVIDLQDFSIHQTRASSLDEFIPQQDQLGSEEDEL